MLLNAITTGIHSGHLYIKSLYPNICQHKINISISTSDKIIGSRAFSYYNCSNKPKLGFDATMYSHAVFFLFINYVLNYTL